MRQLTPELWLHSAMSGANSAIALETREIDLALARRSAVVINAIEGFLIAVGDTLTGFEDEGGMVQEIDLDPDNGDVWLSESIQLDDYVVDSSRVFRQRTIHHFDTATGSTLFSNTHKNIDWYNCAIVDRPITTRNIRHHVQWDGNTGVVHNYEAEVTVRYMIVELTLEELGYINASRR